MKVSVWRILMCFTFVLEVLAFSQPWISERFRWWGSGDENQYRPFQAMIEYGGPRQYFFSDFWFHSPRMLTRSSGMYYGWLLVFVSQILAITLGVIYFFREKIKDRNWHIDGALGFSILALTATLYQRFVQSEIQYDVSFDYFSVNFSQGFWLAVTAAFINLVSYWFIRGERVKSVFKGLKKQWRKTILVMLAVSVVFFFLMNEFQSQTEVIKRLIVQRTMKELPIDPKLWEDHFNRIVTLASIFRGKIIKNYPSYAYCVIAVPLISFQILSSIYNSMGYDTYQDIPGHLF